MPRRALSRAACGFHRMLRSWIISIFIRVFCVYYHAVFGGNRFRAFETGCRFARASGFRRAGRFGLSAAFCAGGIDRRLDRGGVSACFSRGAGRIVYGGIFLSCAYQQANQQMESLSKQWQSQIEAKANEAKKLYEDYQKSANTLSATQKTSKEEAIVAKEKEAAELRKQYFGPEGELMKKRQELISPIQDAIYNAVKEIATQRGYDAVIDRASAQSMIFASPRIDISNEVLAKLGYSN